MSNENYALNFKGNGHSICRFCDKVYDDGRKLGGHTITCKSNPKLQDITNKRSLSNTIERKEYTFCCKKCGKKYLLILKITDFKKGKYTRFCSKSCSNCRAQLDETKAKISRSLTGRRRSRGVRICIICGNSFEAVPSSTKKCCSISCGWIAAGLTMKERSRNVGKLNGMYGKPPRNVHRGYLSGHFFSEKNNISVYYRSSYELRALKILENDDSVISYKCEPFSIPYSEERTTIPDFLVEYKNMTKCIIEVKPKRMTNKKNVSIKILAMKNYAKENDMNFELWTEEELDI